MAPLDELSIYQAKILRTAKTIVDLDRAIASTVEIAQRERLTRHADSMRAMLRAYEGMVSFLNCCIEIERRAKASSESSVEVAKHA